MKDEDIHSIVEVLKRANKKWNTPIVTALAEEGRDPFKVLVSCILSLRTKDDTTREASRRLFSLADTPEGLAKLPVEVIERSIYPVGFYRVKARNLKLLANELIDKYNSRVPDGLSELLRLRGVGRKTANLVLTLGYNKPGICVDTHVHRIFNRLGFLKTKTPEQTEFALRKKLPIKYWKIINDLLVTHGQNICRPLSPLCSQCPIASFCERVGVTKSR